MFDPSVILVVDDDAMVRNVVTILLQRQGYIVIPAADGQEALDLSRKYSGSISMIVTDLQIPKLNGIDLVARLAKERPGIKSLIMSGSITGETSRMNIHTNFLPKPFDGERLKRRVAEIMEPAECLTLAASSAALW